MGKYLIAIASSDGSLIDLGFGNTPYFYVFQVENQQYFLLEKRIWEYEKSEHRSSACEKGGGGCNHHGISERARAKVEMVCDCRAVCCREIGMKIQKEFEKRAIAAFEIEGNVEPIFERIIKYYERIDSRKERE